MLRPSPNHGTQRLPNDDDDDDDIVHPDMGVVYKHHLYIYDVHFPTYLPSFIG